MTLADVTKPHGSNGEGRDRSTGRFVGGNGCGKQAPATDTPADDLALAKRTLRAVCRSPKASPSAKVQASARLAEMNKMDDMNATIAELRHEVDALKALLSDGSKQ